MLSSPSFYMGKAALKPTAQIRKAYSYKCLGLLFVHKALLVMAYAPQYL